jgi:molecular chaperone GrpE
MFEDNKKNNAEQYSAEQIDTDKKSNSAKESDVLKETKEITIEEKLKTTEEKLLRSLAEIENQRRRFEKEIKDAFEFGSFNFAKESLAALDNLQRAKESIKSDENFKSNQDLEKFLENITIIEKDLVSIFSKNRIKKIDTKDQKFDPNIHQAMSEVEDPNVKTGTIIQEIQAGYMLGDRLLRPALVAVSKRNSVKNEEIEDKK